MRILTVRVRIMDRDYKFFRDEDDLRPQSLQGTPLGYAVRVGIVGYVVTCDQRRGFGGTVRPRPVGAVFSDGDFRADDR
jgi:hypothetical protein